MDKFFVKYLNSITNHLSLLEYFLKPFLEYASKTALVLKKLGGDDLFHKIKKLKEKKHQKLKNS